MAHRKRHRAVWLNNAGHMVGYPEGIIMRPGGGSVKGAAFERWLGNQLSQWITNGRRTDLFSRNVLSGGRFTLAHRKGSAVGQPGDLQAAHPLAFPFLAQFMVEAKHLKSIGIEQLFFSFGESNTPLGDIIYLAREQAMVVDKRWLVIARQNNRPTILFTSEDTMKLLTSCLRGKARLPCNQISYDVFACRFNDVTRNVSSIKLIARAKIDAANS